MKKLLFCYLLIITSSFAIAQYSKEEKLEQLKSRNDIKVTESNVYGEKDILKLEYPDGKVIYKNIADYRYPENDIHKPEYSPTYDSTIIDLTTIDTTLYYQKYKFWQTVLISNRKFPIIGDVNGNGRVELYGFEKDYTSDYTSVVAKEMNENGTFDPVWYYNPSTLARNIFDIDSDGSLDLNLTSDESDTVIHWAIMKSKIFSKPSDTSLATNLSFEFQAEDSNTVQYNPRFAMLDGDSRTDYLYLGAPTRQYLGIYEYNPEANSLDSVFQYNYTGIDTWFEGFAVDDFDNDGIPEIIIGGIDGKVASFESTGDNAYQLIWTGEVPTNNAYMLCSTNDIDRNGKNELWVGGDAFYNGVGITRLSCFEATGNNSYEIVGRIDLVGIFAFFAYNIQAVDVDNDGIDELMVCIDGNFLILKFNGSSEHQTYEVYYIKQNDRALQGENSVFWGGTMYDLDNDGKKEILIDWDHIKENIGIRFYTAIYTPDSLTSINGPSSTINVYRLEQNFPNPFNPSTIIKFELPSAGLVQLEVYDILGKEVAELVNEYKPAGIHKVQFNGDRLSSGIYFYKITTQDYVQTKKMILLK